MNISSATGLPGFCRFFFCPIEHHNHESDKGNKNNNNNNGNNEDSTREWVRGGLMSPKRVGIWVYFVEDHRTYAMLNTEIIVITWRQSTAYEIRSTQESRGSTTYTGEEIDRKKNHVRKRNKTKLSQSDAIAQARRQLLNSRVRVLRVRDWIQNSRKKRQGFSRASHRLHFHRNTGGSVSW